MTDKIVDASALAAIVYQEPEEHDMVARLQGRTMYAPALIRFEMANVCLKKSRRHPNERQRLVEQHTRSLSLPIVELPVDHIEVLVLAEAFKLSAYDANYLWLAKTTGFELVTLDGDLEIAARQLQP